MSNKHQRRSNGSRASRFQSSEDDGEIEESRSYYSKANRPRLQCSGSGSGFRSRPWSRYVAQQEDRPFPYPGLSHPQANPTYGGYSGFRSSAEPRVSLSPQANWPQNVSLKRNEEFESISEDRKSLRSRRDSGETGISTEIGASSIRSASGFSLPTEPSTMSIVSMERIRNLNRRKSVGVQTNMKLMDCTCQSRKKGRGYAQLDVFRDYDDSTDVDSDGTLEFEPKNGVHDQYGSKKAVGKTPSLRSRRSKKQFQEEYNLRICFKCRKDRSYGYLHPFRCLDAFKGFMRFEFETRKTIFYLKGHDHRYPRLNEQDLMDYYQMLTELSPANEGGFAERFHEFLQGIEEPFGNFGGRSLVFAYQLLWKKLVVTEAFELPLHDLKIEASKFLIDGFLRPYQLTFTFSNGEDQKYLRNKLIHNGSRTFPIFICIRKRGLASVKALDVDHEHPDSIPRPQVSLTRASATVWKSCPSGKKNGWTLHICPMRCLTPYVGLEKVPEDTIFISFNLRSMEIKKKINLIRDFIDTPSQNEPRFPYKLKRMMVNFYHRHSFEVEDLICLTNEQSLRQFNNQLPPQFKLLPEQMDHVVSAYAIGHEFSGVLGPAGSGKTTMACFMAVYNYFKLKRKTLLVTPHREAADEITLKVIRMFKALLRDRRLSPKTFYDLQQYVWYKAERGSQMYKRDPELERFTSFSMASLEKIHIIIGTLNSMKLDVVERYKPDFVLMDNASSVSTFDFYGLMVMLNPKRRGPSYFTKHLPNNMTLFGDQFQLTPRFSRDTFLTDQDELDLGFNESALMQLLKCNMPYTQMTQVVGLSKVLSLVIQPYYNFDLKTDQVWPEPPLILSFKGCHGVFHSLAGIADLQFVSLFINLPPRTTSGEHYCDADGDRFEQKGKGVSMVNRRNILYAVQLLDAILKHNDIYPEQCLYQPLYRAQENLFSNREVRPGRTKLIPCKTVDRAMGSHADFVLFDLVRTTTRGFMNGQPEEWPTYGTAERLLVGLSRAKKAQIILGSVDRKMMRTSSNALDRVATLHFKSEDPLIRFIDLTHDQRPRRR